MPYELESELEAELENEFRELADPGVWNGSPEQLTFQEQVLNAHIARSSRNGKIPPQSDLSDVQLTKVRGTPIRMRSDAAEAVSRLLEAASADLVKAKAAGHADAMRTVRLTAISGYRSSKDQRNLWLKYFKDYYNETRSRRAAIPGGPHSAGAVSYMLDSYGIPKRIAAPGYSNHQGGIAIDFLQERSNGKWLPNLYKAQKKWWDSWFFGWLQNNAARFGFKQYPKEAWHWEYKPGAAAEDSANRPQQAARSYLGGYINTFTLKTLPVKVSVFCPRAASLQREVEVLVYAHGLLGVCEVPRAGKETEDIITEVPFKLGEIVDSSKRGIVLVVPFFGRTWATQGLGRPANLNGLVDEALAEVGRMRGTAPPSLSNLILAGHSLAHAFLDPLAQSSADSQMQQGALAKLSEVWAFDTTYTCPIDAWMSWLKSKPNLKVSVFYLKNRPRKKSGTAICGAKLNARMKGTGGRLMVTPADPSEDHCSLPVRRLPGLLTPPNTSTSRETENGRPGSHGADLALYELESELEQELEQAAPACPGPTRETVSGFSRYSNSVASLPPNERTKVAKIARLIVQSFRGGCRPLLTVHLVGHADRDLQRERAEPGFMVRISRNRAMEVRQALERLIDNRAISSRIAWDVRGVGASRLAVPNPATEQARMRNRRVELFLSSRPARLSVQELRGIVNLIGFRMSEPALRDLQTGTTVSLRGMSPAEYRGVLARAQARYSRGNSADTAAAEIKLPRSISDCQTCDGACFVLKRDRDRSNKVIRIHCLCFGFLFVHYCMRFRDP